METKRKKKKEKKGLRMLAERQTISSLLTRRYRRAARRLTSDRRDEEKYIGKRDDACVRVGGPRMSWAWEVWFLVPCADPILGEAACDARERHHGRNPQTRRKAGGGVFSANVGGRGKLGLAA